MRSDGSTPCRCRGATFIIDRRGAPQMEEKTTTTILVSLLVLSALLIAFNQYQVSALTGMVDSAAGGVSKGRISFGGGGTASLDKADTSQITSTAMAIKTLFPELSQITDENDAIAIMIPTGTPEYSEALGGITFDDPVASMEYLSKWYYSLKEEVKQQHPDVWQRYLDLAARPTGISCEYCCGVGPQGITSDGELRCGCAHNPAAQAIALGLMLKTDYSDAEVLREVMRWKTIFFPKNMVALAMDVAGKDASQLQSLPGMVGGC